MVGLTICGAVAVLCLVLGVVLCTGRGWQLVAGLNTMEPAERARYDVPKVCRATGVLMLVCAVACACLGVVLLLIERGAIPENSPLMAVVIVAFIAVAGGGCGLLAWYTNTRCKR